MKGKTVAFLMFFLVLTGNTAVCAQHEKVAVESNGLVQKSSSGFDVDRKTAIIAALREAVEKACGVAIRSETQVKAFVLVKDVINSELSDRNNELTMSDYRIVFEPRGYTRIDNSEMLEIKIEVNFKKRGEPASPAISSKKDSSQVVVKDRKVQENQCSKDEIRTMLDAGFSKDEILELCEGQGGQEDYLPDFQTVPIPRPAVPSQLYCCDAYGIARCPMVQPGPIGSQCFCPGQGWGVICGQ